MKAKALVIAHACNSTRRCRVRWFFELTTGQEGEPVRQAAEVERAGVAKKLGLSRECIRQIERETLVKLRIVAPQCRLRYFSGEWQR